MPRCFYYTLRQGQCRKYYAKAEENSMAETVRQPEQATAAEQPERTFTQSEMNAIVSDRLSRERAKYANYEELQQKARELDALKEQGKTELEKATEKISALQKQIETMTRADTIRKLRDKVSAETGVPAAVLSGEDEESCKAQAQAILEFAKPNSYPTVPDGGEVHAAPGGKTRDQFSSWFHEQMKGA